MTTGKYSGTWSTKDAGKHDLTPRIGDTVQDRHFPEDSSKHEDGYVGNTTKTGIPPRMTLTVVDVTPEGVRVAPVRHPATGFQATLVESNNPGKDSEFWNARARVWRPETFVLFPKKKP